MRFIDYFKLIGFGAFSHKARKFVDENKGWETFCRATLIEKMESNNQYRVAVDRYADQALEAYRKQLSAEAELDRTRLQVKIMQTTGLKI